jgi:starvation-inducible outer membrane lipoprotein
MKANVVSISTLILLVTASLMLTACGSIQAGIETATPIADTESHVDTPSPDEIVIQPSEEPTMVEVRRKQIVAGWLGHLVTRRHGSVRHHRCRRRD